MCRAWASWRLYCSCAKASLASSSSLGGDPVGGPDPQFLEINIEIFYCFDKNVRKFYLAMFRGVAGQKETKEGKLLDLQFSKLGYATGPVE
jgi:hypothetical protein